jgi:hypothetical protein
MVVVVGIGVGRRAATLEPGAVPRGEDWLNQGQNQAE